MIIVSANREPQVGVFGEKLRKQREQRGLELDAISNTTKISTRMLRALEDEHFDQLPGGVFNKGFVRAFARQIGLNEEEAVADYLAALRESQIQQQSILPDFRSPASRPNAPVAAQFRENVVAAHSVRSDDINNDATDEANQEDRGTRAQDKDFSPSIISPPQPRERFPQKYPAGSPGEQAVQSSVSVPWGKLAITLLVATVALVAWNFRRHAQPAPASQPVASTQYPAALAPAQPSTQTSASTNSHTAGSASPKSSLSAKTVSPSPVSSPAPPASRETATPPAPAAPTPAARLDAKLPASPQPEVKPPAVHAKARVATVKPPPPFTLLIRANETTWVSLAADGKPIAHETLIAPAHTSIRATHEIVVRTGNSAGISFVLNGKEIPAQGNEGEVRTYTFDATGLQTIQTTTQQQSPAANR
jgi:cytoskeletal protein RodZ